jgi:hypothetical protein
MGSTASVCGALSAGAVPSRSSGYPIIDWHRGAEARGQGRPLIRLNWGLWHTCRSWVAGLCILTLLCITNIGPGLAFHLPGASIMCMLGVGAASWLKNLDPTWAGVAAGEPLPVD